MGKHTRTQDRDLGGMSSTFAVVNEHTLPPLRTLRMVLRHYDRAMQGVGLDPETHDDEARLMVGPGMSPTYKVAGWYLEAGPRG